MSKPTPRPWKVVHETIIASESNKLICSTSDPGHGENIANAAHIVKCVNLFDELVNALDYAVQTHETQKGHVFEKFQDLLRRARGEK